MGASRGPARAALVSPGVGVHAGVQRAGVGVSLPAAPRRLCRAAAHRRGGGGGGIGPIPSASCRFASVLAVTVAPCEFHLLRPREGSVHAARARGSSCAPSRAPARSTRYAAGDPPNRLDPTVAVPRLEESRSHEEVAAVAEHPRQVVRISGTHVWSAREVGSPVSRRRAGRWASRGSSAPSRRAGRTTGPRPAACCI